MEVRLSVTNGKANVKQVVLGAETIIGRSHECNLKIASSQVSRRHCRIVVIDSEVRVSDLGSANGTFLNGRALPPETETVVAPGNALTIGPLRFVFHFKPPVPPKVATGLSDSDTKDAIPLALLGRPAAELGEEETVDSANPKRGGPAAKASPLGPAVPVREETYQAPAQDDDDFEEGLPDRTMSGLKEGPVVVSPPEGSADTVLDMNLAEEARRKAAQQDAARAALPPGEVPESNTDSGTALLSPEDERGIGAPPAEDDTIHIEDPEFPDFKAVDLADDEEDSDDEPPAPAKAKKSGDKGKEKKPWNLLGGMFGGKAKSKRPARHEVEDEEFEEIEEERVAEAPAPPAKSARSKPQPKPVADEPEEIGLPVSYPASESLPARSPAAQEEEFDPSDFLMAISGKEQAENLDPRTKLPGEKPIAGKPPEKTAAPRLAPLEKPSAKPTPPPQVKTGQPSEKAGEEDDGSLDDFLKNL